MKVSSFLLFFSLNSSSCVFPTANAKFARGNCGHLKAKWDNHPSCITCSIYTRSSPCSICSLWSDEIWKLAEKRRLLFTRRSVMTQRRKDKKNKKRILSDPSDTTSLDGSTAPHGCTARGRTHQGGSPLDDDSSWALSPPTGQPVTGQPGTVQPVTGHPVNGQPVISHPVTPVTGQPLTSQPVTPVTSHPATGQPVTSQPVTCQPGTSQPGTAQPVTIQHAFTLDYQSPVTCLYAPNQHSYPALVSSHVSTGSIRRLPSQQNRGYERSSAQEQPNPVLLVK